MPTNFCNANTMTVCPFGRYVKLVGLALPIEKKPYVTAVNVMIELTRSLLLNFGILKAVIY